MTRLQAEMVGSEGQARQLDKISVDYKFLDQDANAKRATYARIVDRLNEATITSQMANANIAVFDPAWVPDAPSDTGALTLALRAATVALLFLFIIPLAIGVLDSRLRTPAQSRNRWRNAFSAWSSACPRWAWSSGRRFSASKRTRISRRPTGASSPRSR